MQKFSARYVWMPEGIGENLTIRVSESGIIESIRDAEPGDEILEGIICTGFVNAHCHLELSHLHGKIPSGTGMAGFVRQLQQIRNGFSDDERAAAALRAADQMYRQGVSGVGDISNGSITATLKAEHELAFHTFVEVFGADNSRAQDIYEQGETLLEDFPAGEASLTIHAPYSVSGLLRDLVYERARITETPISVHLLESAEETRLFRDLDGPLFDFLREVGAPFNGHSYHRPEEFIVNRNREHSLPLNVDIPFMFVHCVEADEETLGFLSNNFLANYVLCPGANQFIHGKLPDVSLFLDHSDFVCIGTDSLAGNESLDMVREMRLLQEACPSLETETLLDWACLNGAMALGLEDALPCEIAPGMPADLVHISGIEPESLRITEAAKSNRLTGL